MKRDIISYFEGVLENIDIISKNSYYKDDDKQNIISARKIIENWYNNYKKTDSLIGIDVNDLKNVGLETTDFFDKYYETESLTENYSERLLYDFGKLEIFWKEEMLSRR